MNPEILSNINHINLIVSLSMVFFVFRVIRKNQAMEGVISKLKDENASLRDAPEITIERDELKIEKAELLKALFKVLSALREASLNLDIPMAHGQLRREVIAPALHDADQAIARFKGGAK